jgi:hypothetical protein
MMDVPMSRSLTVALAAMLFLTSCGFVRESRLNPFNWFGRSEQTETVAAVGADEDPRPLVDDVISMQIEPYSTGVIVRATGITPTQGWWDAELVEAKLEEEDPSHLVLEFRLLPPPAATPVNTPRSREVTVAKTVSVNRLENIRQITVQGARNARTSRATR